jgi:hypothetical protein
MQPYYLKQSVSRTKEWGFRIITRPKNAPHLSQLTYWCHPPFKPSAYFIWESIFLRTSTVYICPYVIYWCYLWDLIFEVAPLLIVYYSLAPNPFNLTYFNFTQGMTFTNSSSYLLITLSSWTQMEERNLWTPKHQSFLLQICVWEHFLYWPDQSQKNKLVVPVMDLELIMLPPTWLEGITLHAFNHLFG